MPLLPEPHEDPRLLGGTSAFAFDPPAAHRRLWFGDGHIPPIGAR